MPLADGLKQFENYERVFNSIEQTIDPVLFVAVNTEEGWKFYWLITIKYDRYNSQRGWESGTLAHIVIDATNSDEIISKDITPLSFTIGYTQITKQEKSDVVDNSQEFIDIFSKWRLYKRWKI